MRKKGKKIMWYVLLVIVILGISGVAFLNMPQFGRLPRGERLERIKKSPNYSNGIFKNLHETPQLTSDKGFFIIFTEFLFKKKDRLKPKSNLPAHKIDLWKLDKNEDCLIWFGHSSYLLQINGTRILVDPVLSGAAAPVSFVDKPFKGTDIYRPQDIPDVDYLIITHDHYDHLDYKTVKAIKDRVGKVICGLGVGEHFEYWGYDKNNIIEMDWNENATLDNGFVVHCLPARHFSGRGLSPNKTLWASYLVQTPSMKIFIGGDSGYDTHFAEIGKQFGDIDLAILEDGQYDKDWKYIHSSPEEVIKAGNDLRAKRLLPVHNSKFALAYHSWDTPMIEITKLHTKDDSFRLLTPEIGEQVVLFNDSIAFRHWWENIN